MEIKNGLVQWNGRNDIPCTYIEMEDGSKYYIKQDLSNGNHIVTTSLLESVDPMAKAKNVGLMGSDGSALIPYTNSSIKSVDNILLVEPAEAVSENVKEAIKLRLDPLSATRLVSTPAQIKEKINAKMSSEGRYLANDQFSEVTITDINGNNLLNDEYYSYVARDGDKLLLAKNNPDTDVKEFSISNNKVVEEVKEEVAPVQEEAPSTEVVVDNASGVVPIVESNPTEVEAIPSEAVDTDLGEEVSIPEIDTDFSFDEITEETPTEVVNEGEGVEVETPSIEDRSNDLETRLSELNEKYNGMNSELDQYIANPETKATSLEDVFNDTDFKVDRIDNIEDEEVSSVDTNSEEYSDAIDVDLARAFDDLVKDNAEKDRVIAEQSNELSEAKDREEKLIIENEDKDSRIKSLEQKNSLATSTIRDLRETISKYEAKLDSSRTALDLQKRKSEEYKRTIGEQERELTRLRSQNEIIRNIRSTVERYRASKEYDNYENEETYSKVA